MLDDRAGPRTETVGIERPEQPLETVDGASPVRVPPAGRESAAVGVDELLVGQRVEPVARPDPAEAGATPAAPRRLGGAERVRMVVVPDHSGLQPLGDGARPRRIPRPHARAETEWRVVGPVSHLPIVVV